MSAKYAWKFVAAEDSTMDSEYVLHINGKKTGIAVQVALGHSFALTEWNPLEDGGTLTFHKEYVSLAQAKSAGEKLWHRFYIA